MIRKEINTKNIKEILKCISQINLEKLESKDMYSSKVDNISSIIAAKKQVRDKLIKFQRKFPNTYAKNSKLAIIEGRDIGTVIFPKADRKIFLWASAEIRAKRRCEQIKKNGKKPSYSRILREINTRDRKDLTRNIAPLTPAENSVLLDTTYIDIEQAFNALKKIIFKI